MKNRLLPLLLLSAGLSVAADVAEPDVQEVQTPEPELAPLTNLVWRLPAKYATLDGDRLVVDIPAEAYPADAVAKAELPAVLFAGAEGFSMTVEAAGSGLAKPTKSWLGLKFQMHWRDGAGTEAWPNCRNAIGDLPATMLRTETSFGGAHPDSITLELGLQGTSGRVVFDLSTLRGAASPGLFQRINQDWIVRYPAVPRAANDAAPRRGVMLPQRDPTEEDFATLAEWGATLVRYQIMRNWNAVGDNRDLAEFAAWIDGKLDCLMQFTHQGVHGSPVGAVWPDPSQGWDRDFIRRTFEPVREFQKRHGAKIYVGEFSAITWAQGADAYLRDCIAVFEEFGWDWSYHAFREWSGWSVEHACEGPGKPFVPSADNPRKRALLDGFRANDPGPDGTR